MAWSKEQNDKLFRATLIGYLTYVLTLIASWGDTYYSGVLSGLLFFTLILFEGEE